MYQRRMSIEQGLFLLAFLLALFFRLVPSGRVCAFGCRGQLAIAGASIARGEVPPLGSQPGHVFADRRALLLVRQQ